MAGTWRENLEKCLRGWMKTMEYYRVTQNTAHHDIRRLMKEIMDNHDAEDEVEEIKYWLEQLEYHYYEIMNESEELIDQVRGIFNATQNPNNINEESANSTSKPAVRIIPPPVFEPQYPPMFVPQPPPLVMPPPGFEFPLAPWIASSSGPIMSPLVETPLYDPTDGDEFTPEMERVTIELEQIRQRREAGQNLGCYICGSLEHETYLHQ